MESSAKTVRLQPDSVWMVCAPSHAFYRQIVTVRCGLPGISVDRYAVRTETGEIGVVYREELREVIEHDAAVALTR